MRWCDESLNRDFRFACHGWPLFIHPRAAEPYTVLTQVGEGAAEAVELPDDEHVARPERAHVTVESRSVVYAGREVLVDVDGVDARSAAGAPCSRASGWPHSPRATNYAARRSSSPTDGATPGPRPSRTLSAEATPRSWSPIPAGRAGEAAENLDRGRQGVPAGHNGPLSRSGTGGSPRGPTCLLSRRGPGCGQPAGWIGGRLSR